MVHFYEWSIEEVIEKIGRQRSSRLKSWAAMAEFVRLPSKCPETANRISDNQRRLWH
jgi:hypothetical protein